MERITGSRMKFPEDQSTEACLAAVQKYRWALDWVKEQTSGSEVVFEINFWIPESNYLL